MLEIGTSVRRGRGCHFSGGTLHHHPCLEQVPAVSPHGSPSPPFGVWEAEVLPSASPGRLTLPGITIPPTRRRWLPPPAALASRACVGISPGGMRRVDIRAQRVQVSGSGQPQARQHRADHPPAVLRRRFTPPPVACAARIRASRARCLRHAAQNVGCGTDVQRQQHNGIRSSPPPARQKAYPPMAKNRSR